MNALAVIMPSKSDPKIANMACGGNKDTGGTYRTTFLQGRGGRGKANAEYKKGNSRNLYSIIVFMLYKKYISK
jgi:hypothetical protein